jgi:16S rRNA (cytosine1402-N4)-methyltransferase
LAPGGRYIGLDIDPDNAAFAGHRLRRQLEGLDVKIDTVHANFTDAPSVLAGLGLDRVDYLLADLGFSSNQIDDPRRGFSFQHDGPLDMRLDPGLPVTAAQLVDRLGQDELADLIYQYGGERRSRRIAKKIVEQRQRSPIQTTTELAQLIRRASVPTGRRGRPGAGRRGSRPRPIDPATRTFMALRIAVNAELESLRQLLGRVGDLLGPGGSAAVISFHSLEDRLVKQAFAQLHRQRAFERLTPKPWVATDAQRRANPRSRSAKLRAIRSLGRAAANDDGYNDATS